MGNFIETPQLATHCNSCNCDAPQGTQLNIKGMWFCAACSDKHRIDFENLRCRLRDNPEQFKFKWSKK